MSRLPTIRPAVVLLVAGGLCAYLIARPINPGRAVEFNELSVDFGDVAEESTYRHDFTFANRSSKPIEVKKVRVSCGCVKTQLGKSALLPGEAGTLTVELNTAGLRAPLKLRRSVLVEFNGAREARLLQIDATIVPPITVKPDRLDVGADEAEKGYRAQMVIERRSLSIDDWRRVRLASLSSCYTVREVVTTDRHKTFDILIRPGQVPGALDPVEVVFGASPNRRIFVPVRVLSPNDVRLVPSTYVAYVSSTDVSSLCDVTKRTFELESTELRGLRVTGICFQDPHLSRVINSTILPGPAAKFVLCMNGLVCHDSHFISTTCVVDYVDQSGKIAGHVRLPVRVMIGIE